MTVSILYKKREREKDHALRGLEREVKQFVFDMVEKNKPVEGCRDWGCCGQSSGPGKIIFATAKIKSRWDFSKPQKRNLQ